MRNTIKTNIIGESKKNKINSINKYDYLNEFAGFKFLNT